MSGLSMNQFLDFVVNTGPVFLSGDDNIINNVSRRSFIMGKMLRGSKASTVLQGGDKIQETLYLNANRSYQQIGRNTSINRQNPQKDVLMQLDWKFAHDQMVWDEAEYLLQRGQNPTKVKYKDMAYSKKQRTWESVVDGFESGLWAPPATTTTETDTFQAMEGSNGTTWYSLPVFVNEGAGSGGMFSDAWTSVEGVNLAANANWRNKRSTYSESDPLDTGATGTGIFDGLDDLSIEVGYEVPGFKDEYFEPDTSYGPDNPKASTPSILATSKAGKKLMMRAHRASNDSLITPQDAAYPLPKWNGLPIKDVSALDAAQLYSDGSTGYKGETESGVAKSGPRFYLLNCNYLKCIFHAEKYFSMWPPLRLPDKVGMFAIDIEVWGNVVCTSLRHQGILSPA